MMVIYIRQHNELSFEVVEWKSRDKSIFIVDFKRRAIYEQHNLQLSLIWFSFHLKQTENSITNKHHPR